MWISNHHLLDSNLNIWVFRIARCVTRAVALSSAAAIVPPSTTSRVRGKRAISLGSSSSRWVLFRAAACILLMDADAGGKGQEQ